MSKKEVNNFLYEDEYLKYESYLKDFTKEKFQEFDVIAKKIGLDSKIKDLINSKIVNETENQAALHPEYRRINLGGFSKPEVITSSSKNYDFESGKKFYEGIEKEFNSCKGSNETVNIISIGIGGSFEGPKLMLEAVNPFGGWHGSHMKYEFITGPNSNEFTKKVNNLNPKKTFFIVFSKSFETIETLEMLRMALDWSGDTKKFLALTSNANKPKEFGISYIHTFDKEIGGRYSIWLEDIAKLFGQQDSISKRQRPFHLGGSIADNKILDDKEYLNFVKYLSYSDIWMNNFNQKHTRVILSYYWKLRSFPAYVQQLEMESLGKPANISSKYKKTGQVIFGGYGPKAEHSYLQLLHQGTQEMCADIIACDEDKNELEYIKAITQTRLLSEGAEDLEKNEKINGNVPVNLFIVKEEGFERDGYNNIVESLGYLIATWEYRTYITATMLDINPFDQFGVNAGKKYTLARKFIKDSS